MISSDGRYYQGVNDQSLPVHSPEYIPSQAVQSSVWVENPQPQAYQSYQYVQPKPDLQTWQPVSHTADVQHLPQPVSYSAGINIRQPGSYSTERLTRQEYVPRSETRYAKAPQEYQHNHSRQPVSYYLGHTHEDDRFSRGGTRTRQMVPSGQRNKDMTMWQYLPFVSTPTTTQSVSDIELASMTFYKASNHRQSRSDLEIALAGALGRKNIFQL